MIKTRINAAHLRQSQNRALMIEAYRLTKNNRDFPNGKFLHPKSTIISVTTLRKTRMTQMTSSTRISVKRMWIVLEVDSSII